MCLYYQQHLILVVIVLAGYVPIWVVCLLHGSITAIMDFWDTYLAGNSEDGLRIEISG